MCYRKYIPHPGDVIAQLTAAPPTCPGNIFTFKCNVTGDVNGVTLWRVGGSKECLLSHSTAGASSICGLGNTAFTATSRTGFGTSAFYFISTMSVMASPTLNGTLVECFGPAFSKEDGNIVGRSTLQLTCQFSILFEFSAGL